MGGDEVQQHAEVRRTRGVVVWLVVAAVLGLVGLPVWAGERGAPTEAAPSRTSTTVPTTRPRPLPVLHVIADTDAGPRPATTASAPDPAATGSTFDAVQATPIVTDGQVVALVDGGAVVVGRPGAAFVAIDLAVPSSALVASNDAGHVWVGAPRDELALVDIDGTDPPVRIPLAGDRVLGPGPFGVVTVSDAGGVSWRRPSFEPTPVAIPAGREVLDAGGRFVLARRPLSPGGGRRFEIWSVVDSSPVMAFGDDGTERPAAIATDGSSVALPRASGWVVHDTETGDERGSLPAAPGEPVWVGDDRWGALVDGTVALSDGTTSDPPWRLRALAEQSP